MTFITRSVLVALEGSYFGYVGVPMSKIFELGPFVIYQTQLILLIFGIRVI